MRAKNDKSLYPLQEESLRFSEALNTNALGDWIVERKRNTPGFFDPFHSGRDFGETLSYPIVSSVSLGVLTGVTAIVTAATALIAIGSLIFASGAALLLQGNYARNGLETAADMASVAGIALLSSVVLTVASIVGPVMSLAYLVTRSTATLASPIVNSCLASEENSMNTVSI